MITNLSKVLAILFVTLCSPCSSADHVSNQSDPITQEAFFQLSKSAQSERILSAIEAQLNLFSNLEYTTVTTVFTPDSDCTRLPFSGEVPKPPEAHSIICECTSKFFDGSYLMTTLRKGLGGGSEPSDITINRYDATIGEHQGTNTAYDGRKKTNGSIRTDKDIVDKEDRLQYWGRGKTEPRGVFFLDEAWQLLNLASSYPTNDNAAAITIKKGSFNGQETVELSFKSIIATQVGRDGLLVIHFVPDKNFFPVCFRLERFVMDGNERKVKWFESMLVLDEAECGGILFPRHFQIVQSNSVPTKGATIAVYDVKVQSITHGTLALNDLEFVFPAGSRVIDRIREVGFVADGKGGTVGDKKSIASFSPMTDKKNAGNSSFSIYSIVVFNLGLLLIIAGATLIRLRSRRKPSSIDA